MIDGAINLLAIIRHELTLFAAAGLAIGGIDDVVIDLVFLFRRGWRRIAVYSRHPRMTMATLPRSDDPGRIAIFVPAWQESEVIGPMVRHALRQWKDADFRLFIGAYPNDPGTAMAAIEGAGGSEQAIIRIHDRPGPTTKADCLNGLWRTMLAEEERAIM